MDHNQQRGLDDIRVVELCDVCAPELWVFETLQGSGGPPGGLLPPGQTPARSLKSSQRAEKSSSGVAPVVIVARWEDEGRQRGRGGAHLISAAEDLKPRCCWSPERRGQTRIRRGFNDVPLRWDSVSRHSCAPVGNNVSVPPLRSHQGLRGLFRFGTGVL